MIINTEALSLVALSLADLTRLESAIQAEKARRAGVPHRIKDRGIDIPPPAGGVLLHIDWAVADLSTIDWYPGLDEAEAALAAIASNNGRKILYPIYEVDLTAPGCQPSRAWLEENSK